MSGQMQLRKFSTTLYQGKSANDLAQVPITDAAITIYRQGATVTSFTSILTSNTSLNVRNVGHLLVNDQVQLGTDSTKQMQVVAINSDTNITIKSTTGQTISVTGG